MKGSKKVTDQLNLVLVEVLTSINQYFLHSKIFQNEGLFGLSKKVYKESIRVMKDADKLTERILFLEALPNLQKLERLQIGETTKERFEADLKRSDKSVVLLKDAIAVCESEKDYVSRELLEALLEGEEEYLDWSETQLELISKMGCENYLAEKIKEEG